jgi:DnaJ-class molecular chaperone
MITCESCYGTGETHYLPRFSTSPEDVRTIQCRECDGYGILDADEELPVVFEWEDGDLEHLMMDADTHPGHYLPGEVIFPVPVILKQAA